VIDSWDRQLGGRPLQRPARNPGLLLERDRHPFDPFELLEEPPEVLEHILGERARRIDEDLERDLPAADRELLDAAERDEILVAVGILDPPDRADDVSFLYGGLGGIPARMVRSGKASGDANIAAREGEVI
jgi:hypothetical protein